MDSTIEPIATSAEKPKRDLPVIKRPNRLWLFVLVLGWIFDFLFWHHLIGVNFAIFSALCLLGGLILLVVEGYRPARNSLWLLIPFIFFTAVTFLRQEPLTIFLAYTFTFFSVVIFGSTYLGGRWMQYGLLDYFNKPFQLAVSMIVRSKGFIAQVRKEQASLGETKNSLPVLPLLRGMLIALPVVICFASLLASADLVFNQKLADFIGLFNFGNIIEYIFRFLLILFYAYLLAGAFLHAASQSKDEVLFGEDKPLIKPFLGFIESSVVLGCVAFLFLAFVVIQFQYFFGGQANIGVAGYTYSQYARRGFAELVMVAFFSLLLILGLSNITRRENEIQRRIYSGLSVAIVLQVMVILTSAYQRLTLAIEWHGFSRIRLYPSVFLIWVGILLVAIVALEIFRKERFFAFAFAIASIGFAVSLAVVNVDVAIVKRNIFRVEMQGKNLNVAHLASLSTDAIPLLVDKFQSPSSSAEIKEGVGAVLVCYTHSGEIQLYAPQEDWQSFNLLRWCALEALKKIQPQLTGYLVSGKGMDLRVRTPNNILYECYDQTIDYIFGGDD
jgi:hypothetical protein